MIAIILSLMAIALSFFAIGLNIDTYRRMQELRGEGEQTPGSWPPIKRGK